MINKTESGFEIYHQDLLLIKHDKSKPAIYLGNKALRIEMENGEFKFHDDTLFNPVFDFVIRDNVIEFDDFSLEINHDESEYLKIGFRNLNQPIKILLQADKNETIYGLGENFTSLNLKGKVVKNWIQEHITRKQIYSKIIRRIFKLKPKKWRFEDYKTYFVSPSFISSKKYFCHVDTYGYGIFDFADENTHQLTFYSNINEIRFCKSDSLLELTGLLSKYVGKMPKLPDWIYDGMIFAIQGGSEVVNDKIELLLNHNVKVNGVWSQDWCGELFTFFGKQVFWNWEADEILYPNLKENIKTWADQKIKFLTYINPYLNIYGNLYQIAEKADYLVKNKDGTTFLTKATSFDFGIVDLTNNDAYNWFKEIIKTNYLEIGIMGWMADFGEYLPVNCHLNSGLPEELHNYWPDLWAKLNREVLEESNLVSSAIFFNRSGYKDNSKYSTLVWNGDQHVDFTDDFGMASALRAMLSLSFSGIGFSHSDIGGYTTVPGIKRSKELYLRWLEMNAFTPVMRSHEGNKPWKNVQFDYDDETLEFTSKFSNIHYLLKKYFIEVEKEYHNFGYPVIRPTILHFDYYTDKAFLVGKDLLVYPVMTKNKKRQKVYIPEGKWIHLLTGEQMKNGETIVNAPIGTPPVFFNENSLYKEVFSKISVYINNLK